MGPFDAALLVSSIGLTIPLLLAATGEMISERAGVLNVGLEGMILAGAFFSFLAAWGTHSLFVGLVAGIAAGAAFGMLMAFVTVDLGADQIVVGIGINIVAVGITTLAYDQIFGDRAKQAVIDTVSTWSIPGLSSTGVGKALFAQDPVTYLAFLLIPTLWFIVYRTTWGLALRSTGEEPVAADTAGISVRRVRWCGTLTAGAFAGLAGAYLAIVQLGLFRQEMSAGRGFLALAAVIFGRWHPVGVLGACFAFGAADALQLRLQDQSEVPHQVWIAVTIVVAAVVLAYALRRRRRPRGLPAAAATALAVAGVLLFAERPSVDLPAQLWLALPFLLALVALAGSSGRTRMPSALTAVYRRGER